MQVRIIKLPEKTEDCSGKENELLSYFEVDKETRLDELLKTFYVIQELQKNDDIVTIEVNALGIADYFGDDYEIESISLNVPSLSKDTLPYVAVYVKEMY